MQQVSEMPTTSRKQYADKNWSWDKGHPSEPVKKFSMYAPRITMHKSTKIITIDAIIGGKDAHASNPNEWYVRKFLHAEYFHSDVIHPLQTLAYIKKFATKKEMDLIQLTPKVVKIRQDLPLEDALLDHRLTIDQELNKFTEIYCNMCDTKNIKIDCNWLYAAMATISPLQHRK